MFILPENPCYARVFYASGERKCVLKRFENPIAIELGEIVRKEYEDVSKNKYYKVSSPISGGIILQTSVLQTSLIPIQPFIELARIGVSVGMAAILK